MQAQNNIGSMFSKGLGGKKTTSKPQSGVNSLQSIVAGRAK